MSIYKCSYGFIWPVALGLFFPVKAYETDGKGEGAMEQDGTKSFLGVSFVASPMRSGMASSIAQRNYSWSLSLYLLVDTLLVVERR